MLLRGQDFHSEKAIISIELYRKGVWRFAAVANGFNGGLGDLLRSYGGEELTAPPQPAPQKTEKISLKKGQKVSLSKTAAPQSSLKMAGQRPEKTMISKRSCAIAAGNWSMWARRTAMR